MGVIVLKNKRTGNVNIMSLSINQFYATSELEGKNYGDLEFLKSFLFANMFKEDLFPQSNGKLAQILVYNPINNSVYSRTSIDEYDKFKERMYKSGLKDALKLTEKNISGIEDIAIYNLDVNLRKFDGSRKEDINMIFSKFRDTNLDTMDIEQLIDIQRLFFEKFSEYKDRTMKDSINFEDPKEVLLALLQVAIVSKGQMSLSGDFQRMSKLSLGFSDLYSLVAALYTNDKIKYDKEGRKIQGLVQGLLWTTPD
jgi:hypothetical protein